MQIPHFSVVLPSLALLLAAPAAGQDSDPPARHHGTRLSENEINDGWHWLFAGGSPDAWRGWRQKDFPSQGWVVKGSYLVHEKGKGGGDLVSRRRFANFDLRLLFRVAPGANSGVIYRAAEDADACWHTGPELQILDDAAHEGAATSSHGAGALYDLYPAAGKLPKPAGQWNEARIIADGDRIEHWLNGVRVVQTTFGSDDWNERLAKSKFKDMPRFAKVQRGHIVLQDHGDEVWFSEIRIRELPPSPSRRLDEIVLFDGKSLERWDAFLAGGAKLADVWSIDPEGVLVCKGNPMGYLYTKDELADYILTLEWRFNPVTKQAGNSGVLLRLRGEDKIWPRSIEALLHSGNAGDFWNIGEVAMQTDASRTQGRNTKKTHGAEKPVGEWNRYEIVVDGPWVQLRVNGEVLNEAWECDPTAGRIGLQSEGAEIHFRNIKVTPLRRE